MTLSPGYKHQRPITDVQLAEVIAKRTRDGVARGERHRRAHEAEAAAEAAPLPLLTPAQRAAMILNAYQVAPDGRIEVRYLDEIAGRRLDYTGRVALRDVIRKASGRLMLGVLEDSLWTIKDGSDRLITVWIKKSMLSARVTGPRHRRPRLEPPAWPLFVAEATGSRGGCDLEVPRLRPVVRSDARPPASLHPEVCQGATAACRQSLSVPGSRLS